MAELKLNLTMKQSLVMTPQLQQSIQLLQMPLQDIQQFVEQQLQENPLLMREDAQQQPNADGAEKQGDAGDKGAADNAEFQDTDWANSTQALDNADVTNWAESATSGTAQEAGYYLPVSSGTVSPDEVMEQTVAEQQDLRSFLREQIGTEALPVGEQMLVDYLIDLLDEAGYLHESLEQLSRQLGCTEDDMEDALDMIQRCEPVGVGARTLEECLLLQLKEQGEATDCMCRLVSDLPLVSKGDAVAIARHCGVSKEEVPEMLALLKDLNPKPGLQVGSDVVQTRQVDMTIAKNKAGVWQVELRQDALPRVLMNKRYYMEVKDKPCNDEEKAFVNDCWQQANWLMKALDQRANTMVKVGAAIVKRQQEFFDHGVAYLKPMTMREIADDIEMHESTVSRVVAHKMMETSRGLLELRYFFASGIATGGDDGLSSQAVKHRIKQLIDAETPKAILSDDKIADMLQKEGLDIARRTVAKYREAMNYGSSVQRRREKRTLV